MLIQSLQQKQKQRLAPLQIQLIKLLALPVQDLEQRVKEELEKNPALEEDNNNADNADTSEKIEVDFSDVTEVETYRQTPYNSSSSDTNLQQVIRDSSYTLGESLLRQLSLRSLSARQMTLGSYLVGCMDSDGYIRRSLSAIADDAAFTQGIDTTEQELEDVLKIIQDLDPPGIGARDLQECLLLQLKYKEKQGENVELAQKILTKTFNHFVGKRYDKIAEELGCTEENMRTAIDEIIKLNPKPGNCYSEEELTPVEPTIFPDFVVEVKDGELQLSLASRNMPSLKVSDEYSGLLRKYLIEQRSDADKEALIFTRKKIDMAKWFIEAIKQRQNTLIYVMNAIIGRQKEFFLTGDETKLKPLILKNIAEATGFDLSTISRVVSSKYVQTNFGIYPLRFFFSESAQSESGEEVSTRVVKRLLATCIEEEDKKFPYSDEELVEILKRKGFKIARRTVAKYRDQQGIPAARFRKQV